MPANFDRFRYLNGSSKETTEVKYAGFSDLAGTTPRLPPRTPVTAGSEVTSGGYVIDAPTTGATTTDLASLRVMKIVMTDGATLTNWLLPSPINALHLVEADISVTDGGGAGQYIAHALLLFDTGYQEADPKPFEVAANTGTPKE